jgi:hypothetical protein
MFISPHGENSNVTSDVEGGSHLSSYQVCEPYGRDHCMLCVLNRTYKEFKILLSFLLGDTFYFSEYNNYFI